MNWVMRCWNGVVPRRFAYGCEACGGSWLLRSSFPRERAHKNCPVDGKSGVARRVLD